MKAKLYIEAWCDPTDIEEARDVVQSIQGFGRVVQAELVIPAETRVDLLK